MRAGAGAAGRRGGGHVAHLVRHLDDPVVALLQGLGASSPFSFVSRAAAACSATSTLPHSTARLKRVCSSVTKWRATWKPFFWR